MKKYPSPEDRIREIHELFNSEIKISQIRQLEKGKIERIVLLLRNGKKEHFFFTSKNFSYKKTTQSTINDRI